MDENLYDEFGNYVGPEFPDVDNFSEEEQEIKSIEEQNNQEERGVAEKIIVSFNRIYLINEFKI